MPVTQRTARNIFVIVTDRHESASTKFSGAQVRSMVAERRAVGAQAEQSMGVMKSSRGSSRSWSTVARESVMYSMSTSDELNFDQPRASYAQENAERGNNPQ